MKKTISFILVFLLFYAQIWNNISFALVWSNINWTAYNNYNSDTSELVFPSWDKFDKLKDLIDKYFVESKYNYWQKYLSNIMYNEIIEAEIKAIIIDTFKWNENFYKDLFFSSSYYWDTKNKSELEKVLGYVPKNNYNFKIKNILFNNRIAWDRLMNASFWIDYNPNVQDSLIIAVKRIIDNFKNVNWYYPSLEELKKERVYNNWNEVYISSIIDEIYYKKINIDHELNPNYIVIRNESILKKAKVDLVQTEFDEIKKDLSSIENSWDLAVSIYKKYKKRYDSIKYDRNKVSERDIYASVTNLISNVYFSDSYTIERKNNIYSYTEALKKNKEIIEQNNYKNEYKELERIKVKINDYYLYNWKYPDSLNGKDLELLNEFSPDIDFFNSFSEGDITDQYDDTKDGFDWEKYNYKILDDSNVYSLTLSDDFKKYLDSKQEPKYKDYKKLIWDNEVENIPEIYKNIPNDSIFLHVKNPKFIFDLINRDNSLLNSSLWVWTLEKLKDLTQKWFDIKDFKTVEENLKHEFIVVISDLDLTAPDITIIINKEDKDVLVPTDNPKVAVTKWDYIYISNSKESLEKFDNLKEEDSIYNSLDFRYLWLQKWNKFKDIFFFAWDKFFENMISFDNFIKMKRKINDYLDLNDFQNYVWWYKRLYWRDITFSDLNNFFENTKIDKDKTMQNLDISKDSIVKHKSIWTVDNIKWLSEINYDLSFISSDELMSYQKSVLNYREVWRASLDPMWIFINSLDDGYSIDFFMTPIPDLKNNDFGFLKLLFWTWIKEFDLLKNDKLRIGTIWWMIWFDVDKLTNKIINADESDRDLYYLRNDIDDLNKELFDWWDIFDYLWWEAMLWFGWFDSTILDSFDSNKLDAFLAIEFTSKLKAKELISIIRKKISEDYSWYYWIDDTLKEALIKPISQEYNWETIYSVPLRSFFFPITFYYTIIDNFLYITLSDNSIKKIIDYSINPTKDKQKFIDKMSEEEKIFYWFLDAWKLEPVIKNLVSGTWTALEDIYLEIMSNRNLWNINPISLEISQYYQDSLYRELLWKQQETFKYKWDFLNIFEKDKELYLIINKEIVQTPNLEVNKELDSFFSKIDEIYFSEEWWKLIELLWDDDLFSRLLKIDIFNKLVNSDFLNNFFLNISLDLNLGDDIIEFSFASFWENFKLSKSKDKNIFSLYDSWAWINKTIYIYLGIFILLFLWSGLFFIKRKKKI